MATSTLSLPQPKSLIRPTHWSKEVENAYRFQLAGYRDEMEYKRVRQVVEVLDFIYKFFLIHCIVLFNRLMCGQIVALLRNYNVEKMDFFIILINFVNVQIKKSINVKYIHIKNKYIYDQCGSCLLYIRKIS